MDSGIINPSKLPFLGDGNKGKDPITLAPTFYGDEYTDTTAYLKFNNAVERMSQPREVEHTEVDVEFVTRNDAGSLYAVVYHYEDGSVDSDMLMKMKNGGWSFYRSKIRFHPNFVGTYVSSIWGYRKPTELQVMQEIAKVPAHRSNRAICENHILDVFPGGIAIFKCVIRDGELTSIESIDFIEYESLERDKIKAFYQEVLHRFVDNEDLNIEDFPEELIKEILNKSLERMKKKYGDKGKNDKQ